MGEFSPNLFTLPGANPKTIEFTTTAPALKLATAFITARENISVLNTH
jgi:hypothetical protein